MLNHLTILLLMWMMFPLCAVAQVGGSVMSSDEVLDRSRFGFFDEPLTMRFTLCMEPSCDDFTGVIFRALSENGTQSRILLDWQRGSVQQIVLTADDRIEKIWIPSSRPLFEGDTASIRVTMDFRSSLTEIAVGDTVLRTANFPFTINNGYKFSLLPDVARDKRGRAVISYENFSASTLRSRRNVGSWYWLAGVIVADMLLFWVVHIARVRRRRRLIRERYEAMSAAGDPDTHPVKMEFPRSGAVYMIGGFHVYDRSGEEITRKFSPLVKELFAMLILYSSDKGISSEKMHEILWYDKDEASARNNRAVNIGKLRALLDTVGDYEISNKTGYWRISLDTIFVDYILWDKAVGKVADGRLAGNADTVMTIVEGGGLLSEEDYLWLDDFKSDLADRTIDMLSGYAAGIDPAQDFVTSGRIADAIFALDPVNEPALHLRCRAYIAAGKHNAAKSLYERFAKEYENIYGETYRGSLRELTGQKESGNRY